MTLPLRDTHFTRTPSHLALISPTKQSNRYDFRKTFPPKTMRHRAETCGAAMPAVVVTAWGS